ncbi:protein kinase [Bifidobacterium sp. ESL0775]|uniref:serine/threonine-protein kinase n=1 Tax=Bifidobacterium sp. ESL0775 TaxID=2983230 RepID=UPI0023F7C086|nr:serine/threonine protein kinase [Bifidobacterium sp. ESL0775]WEV69358.1 protein kinase [Bifidobacterium sp. ESL0775]
MSDLNALDLEPGEIVGGYTLISRLGGGAMGSVWRVRDDGGQVYAMKILRDSLKDDGETGGSYQNDDISAENNSGSYTDVNSVNGSTGYDSTGNNAAGNGYGASGYGQNNGNVGAGNTSQPHHHHSHDPHVTARERMRREAVAMRKINHPGVCAIVDMELDDSLAFIVTELIEGKNLRDDVAANGRYVGDDLQRLASKLIDAVRAVHAQGIIHRDIKPTNVMVSASGPVLVDFGIAMTAGESHVTRTGLVMGTPGFIAPEIIDGAESNEATDWWSLASVIAFAATGRPVFGSKPMMAVLEREASGNANLAGLPPNTLNALRSALDPDPAKRCSPDQLLQAISLDALNPFANGELDDEDDGIGNEPVLGAGNFGNTLGAGNPDNPDNPASDTPNGTAQGVVPPFGQRPRTDPTPPNKASNSLRTSWTDNPAGSPTQSLGSPQPQLRGSTRAMPRPTGNRQPAGNRQAPSTQTLRGQDQPEAGSPAATTPDETVTEALPSPSAQDLTATSAMPQNSGPATATMPLDTDMTRGMEPTSTLPTSNPPAAQQSEAGTMPLAVSPAMQTLQPLDPSRQAQPVSYAPYIYGPGQPNMQVAAAPQPLEPIANPADVRRGKLISRSRLPLWLATVPLALLAATAPLVSLCCAAALVWLLLTLGYSEEAQLEREGKRGGIRKKSDMALRVASLPWHVLKALVFAIVRALGMALIADVAPIVVSLVSGLPTKMVDIVIGSWRIPFPLSADLSLSYSSAALAIFMAAAWLITAFGPKTTILRIGAGRLRGMKPEPGTGDPAMTALPESAAPPSDEYLGTEDELDDEAEDIEETAKTMHHLTWRWILLILWIILTLAALALALTNRQIDWVPLPNPQL